MFRNVHLYSAHRVSTLCAFAAALCVFVGCSDDPKQQELKEVVPISQDPASQAGQLGIQGVAIDWETRQPIPNVTISSVAPTEQVRTREDGSFVLVEDAVPDALYRVLGEAPGYETGLALTQTTREGLAVADLLMLQDGDGLPVVVEPRTVLFDQNTHGILVKARNLTNEPITWTSTCEPPNSEGEPLVVLEPGDATLSGGRETQLLARLHPDAFRKAAFPTSGESPTALRCTLVLQGQGGRSTQVRLVGALSIPAPREQVRVEVPNFGGDPEEERRLPPCVDPDPESQTCTEEIGVALVLDRSGNRQPIRRGVLKIRARGEDSQEREVFLDAEGRGVVTVEYTPSANTAFELWAPAFFDMDDTENEQPSNALVRFSTTPISTPPEPPTMRVTFLPEDPLQRVGEPLPLRGFNAAPTGLAAQLSWDPPDDPGAFDGWRLCPRILDADSCSTVSVRLGDSSDTCVAVEDVLADGNIAVSFVHLGGSVQPFPEVAWRIVPPDASADVDACAEVDGERSVPLVYADTDDEATAPQWIGGTCFYDWSVLPEPESSDLVVSTGPPQTLPEEGKAQVAVRLAFDTGSSHVVDFIESLDVEQRGQVVQLALCQGDDPNVCDAQIEPDAPVRWVRSDDPSVFVADVRFTHGDEPQTFVPRVTFTARPGMLQSADDPSECGAYGEDVLGLSFDIADRVETVVPAILDDPVEVRFPDGASLGPSEVIVCLSQGDEGVSEEVWDDFDLAEAGLRPCPNDAPEVVFVDFGVVDLGDESLGTCHRVGVYTEEAFVQGEVQMCVYDDENPSLFGQVVQPVWSVPSLWPEDSATVERASARPLESEPSEATEAEKVSVVVDFANEDNTGRVGGRLTVCVEDVGDAGFTAADLQCGLDARGEALVWDPETLCADVGYVPAQPLQDSYTLELCSERTGALRVSWELTIEGQDGEVSRGQSESSENVRFQEPPAVQPSESSSTLVIAEGGASMRSVCSSSGGGPEGCWLVDGFPVQQDAGRYPVAEICLRSDDETLLLPEEAEQFLDRDNPLGVSCALGNSAAFSTVRLDDSDEGCLRYGILFEDSTFETSSRSCEPSLDRAPVCVSVGGDSPFELSDCVDPVYPDPEQLAEGSITAPELVGLSVLREQGVDPFDDTPAELVIDLRDAEGRAIPGEVTLSVELSTFAGSSFGACSDDLRNLAFSLEQDGIWRAETDLGYLRAPRRIPLCSEVPVEMSITATIRNAEFTNILRDVVQVSFVRVPGAGSLSFFSQEAEGGDPVRVLGDGRAMLSFSGRLSGVGGVIEDGSVGVRLVNADSGLTLSTRETGLTFSGEYYAPFQILADPAVFGPGNTHRSVDVEVFYRFPNHDRPIVLREAVPLEVWLPTVKRQLTRTGTGENGDPADPSQPLRGEMMFDFGAASDVGDVVSVDVLAFESGDGVACNAISGCEDLEEFEFCTPASISPVHPDLPSVPNGEIPTVGVGHVALGRTTELGLGQRFVWDSARDIKRFSDRMCLQVTYRTRSGYKGVTETTGPFTVDNAFQMHLDEADNLPNAFASLPVLQNVDMRVAEWGIERFGRTAIFTARDGLLDMMALITNETGGSSLVVARRGLFDDGGPWGLWGTQDGQKYPDLPAGLHHFILRDLDHDGFPEAILFGQKNIGLPGLYVLDTASRSSQPPNATEALGSLVLDGSRVHFVESIASDTSETDEIVVVLTEPEFPNRGKMLLVDAYSEGAFPTPIYEFDSSDHPIKTLSKGLINADHREDLIWFESSRLGGVNGDGAALVGEIVGLPAQDTPSRFSTETTPLREPVFIPGMNDPVVEHVFFGEFGGDRSIDLVLVVREDVGVRNTRILVRTDLFDSTNALTEGVELWDDQGAVERDLFADHRIEHVLPGDLNGDGRMDLVFVSDEPFAAQGGVAVWLNTGPLSHAQPITLHLPLGDLPTGPRVVDLGDMNNDGLDDLVVFLAQDIDDPNPTRALVYHSSIPKQATTARAPIGGFAFRAHEGALFAGPELRDTFGPRLFPFEINQDGRMDLLSWRVSARNASLLGLYGQGNGHFVSGVEKIEIDGLPSTHETMAVTEQGGGLVAVVAQGNQIGIVKRRDDHQDPFGRLLMENSEAGPSDWVEMFDLSNHTIRGMVFADLGRPSNPAWEPDGEMDLVTLLETDEGWDVFAIRMTQEGLPEGELLYANVTSGTSFFSGSPLRAQQYGLVRAEIFPERIGFGANEIFVRSDEIVLYGEDGIRVTRRDRGRLDRPEFVRPDGAFNVINQEVKDVRAVDMDYDGRDDLVVRYCREVDADTGECGSEGIALLINTSTGTLIQFTQQNEPFTDVTDEVGYDTIHAFDVYPRPAPDTAWDVVVHGTRDNRSVLDGYRWTPDENRSSQGWSVLYEEAAQEPLWSHTLDFAYTQVLYARLDGDIWPEVVLYTSQTPQTYGARLVTLLGDAEKPRVPEVRTLTETPENPSNVLLAHVDRDAQREVLWGGADSLLRLVDPTDPTDPSEDYSLLLGVFTTFARGDLNGDGAQDVVSWTAFSSSFSVLVSDVAFDHGPGTPPRPFATATLTENGPPIVGLLLEDVDRDGQDEIVIVRDGGFDGMSIEAWGWKRSEDLSSRGDFGSVGSRLSDFFEMEQTLTVSVSNPLFNVSLHAVESNGDGFPELWIFGEESGQGVSGSALYALANNEGSFATPSPVSSADRAVYGVSALDVDGDGRDEVFAWVFDGDLSDFETLGQEGLVVFDGSSPSLFSNEGSQIHLGDTGPPGSDSVAAGVKGMYVERIAGVPEVRVWLIRGSAGEARVVHVERTDNETRVHDLGVFPIPDNARTFDLVRSATGEGEELMFVRGARPSDFPAVTPLEQVILPVWPH